MAGIDMSQPVYSINEQQYARIIELIGKNRNLQLYFEKKLYLHRSAGTGAIPVC
jgi:hypothetical protein